MKPTTKPRTIVINSRCDIRSIATLHRYWQEKGYGNLNMSQLLRLSVDQFADVLVANKLAKPFEFSVEAEKYVTEVKLSVPLANREALARQIQRETLIDEGFGTEYIDKPIKSVYGKNPARPVKKSLIEQARDIMRNASNEETLKEAVERRDKEQDLEKTELGKPPASD